jgi:hypothetical protein
VSKADLDLLSQCWASLYYHVQVGTSIWFVSLRQRNHFAKVWVKQSPNEQAHLQNKVSIDRS